MDEAKEINIMVTKPPLAEPLSWRDGAIPLLAICLAWIFWACFDPVRVLDFGVPHLGVLVLVLAHFAAVLVTLGKRARFTVSGVFCAAAALALAVSCAVWDEMSLTETNYLAILLLAAMATFALAGRTNCGLPRTIPETASLTILALFTRLGIPFRALGQVGRRADRKKLGGAIASVLLALPVLAVVLRLLSSADAVFSDLFSRVRFDFPAGYILRPLRVLATALFLASALYFIREEPAPRAAEKPEKPRRAALFLPVTALLDIVYIIFCYIQVKYLFGGAEEAFMAGGWAGYARSGFFQLVYVTIINLGLVLLGTDPGRFASRGGKLLRALYGLLLILTAVILVSAFWRMRLYIGAFGLSILRLLTLWAMAVVCFSLLAAAWKLARPGARFFRAAGSFALALWCLMSLAGPARMIANYNVDQYLSGSLTEVDTDYLRRLGADALPALRALGKDPNPPPTDRPWAQMSLSAWRAAK